ncbi:hypothetical protein AAVH_07555 [Aphelenchoides avenae]|nr:hypothetical protein AAVH_07555 [Aphelenchus avenae]
MSETLVEAPITELHNGHLEAEADPEQQNADVVTAEECPHEPNRSASDVAPLVEDERTNNEPEEPVHEPSDTPARVAKRTESADSAEEKENEKKVSTGQKLACTSCGRDSKHSAELIQCQCGKTHQMCRINKWVHCDCGLFTSRCVFCGKANSGTRKCEKCGQRC